MQVVEDESKAAELALATLLVSAAGMAGGRVLHAGSHAAPEAMHANMATLKNDFRPMSRLWNQRHNTLLPQDPEFVEPGMTAYKHAPVSLMFKNLNENPIHVSSSFRSQGPARLPQVLMNPLSSTSTMAHEMGHAEMAGRIHRNKATFAQDPVAWMQEKRFGQGSQSWALGNLFRGGPGWRTLLPLAVPAIGAAGGVATGPEGGAVIGGLTGLAAAAPVLAYEAEAWRRGEDYAKAAGVGRRAYYRHAMVPFLSYLLGAVGTAGLGAGAGALGGASQ